MFLFIRIGVSGSVSVSLISLAVVGFVLALAQGAAGSRLPQFPKTARLHSRPLMSIMIEPLHCMRFVHKTRNYLGRLKDTKSQVK